jgi:hypothetical protein
MKNNVNYNINNKTILKKQLEIQNIKLKLNRFAKIKKYSGYFLAIAFPVSYIFFVLKSSGLLKELQIDKKVINRKKSIEKFHGIDTELNNQRIEDFDKNWGINLVNDEIENRKKNGNKILNEKPEAEIIIKEEIMNEKVLPIVINKEEDQNPLTHESNVFFDSKFTKNPKPKL